MSNESVYLPGKIRDRIQDLMKSRKVTQAELATRIGCSESSLSRFISGKTDKLGDENIIRIARVFNVQNTPPKLMMPDLIFRLVPNEKVNAVFLWQLINCKEFRPVIQAISGGSAKSMSNISKERLGKIKVICPPRELQDSLIPFVKRVDKSKVVEAIYKTNTLFNIILNGGNRYDIRANEF